MTIKELCEKAHAASRSKGWYDDGARNIPEMSALEDRVAELRAWALSRIEWCRGEENRLGVNGIGIYEAAQERRTLQAVLRMLDARAELADGRRG